MTQLATAQTDALPIRTETFVDIDAIAQPLGGGAQQPAQEFSQLSSRLCDERIYQQWIATWLEALAPQLSPIRAYEIGLKLTTDNEIQQLNTDYRQKNQPTDVLSFAALETELPGREQLNRTHPLYLGDIIISVETAARQASSACHSLEREIAWLTSHGLLHLLGWDHPNESSLEIMLSKQAELVALVEIP